MITGPTRATICLILSALSLVPHTSAAQAPPCWSHSAFAVSVLFCVRAVSVDGEAAALRTTLDVPYIADSSRVSFVRDTVVCRAASEAVKRMHEPSVRDRLLRVVVVAAGPTRLFVSVATRTSRGSVVFVLDQQMRPYVSF